MIASAIHTTTGNDSPDLWFGSRMRFDVRLVLRNLLDMLEPISITRAGDSVLPTPRVARGYRCCTRVGGKPGLPKGETAVGSLPPCFLFWRLNHIMSCKR
jgi:hypothetical protein